MSQHKAWDPLKSVKWRSITNKVHFLHEMFIFYDHTNVGVTAIFKVNTTILGTLSMPKRLNIQHIDMITDSKRAEISL